MTVPEIAGLLKLSRQTIYNWIDAGTLPHLQAGERRVRVWRSDLLALMEKGATVTPPPAEVTPTIWDGFIAMPVTPDQPRRS